MIEKREEILKKNEECVDYVDANCFYCNKCWQCCVTKREATKKGMKSFNSDIKWSIDWYKGKDGENLPKLNYHA